MSSFLEKCFYVFQAKERMFPFFDVQTTLTDYIAIGLRQLLFVFHIHPPLAMNPGTPVFTTLLSLCLV